jgi:hypothetical protein
MRVRVTRRASGVIGGVSLGHLEPGGVYDLPEDAAWHLIDIRAGVEAPMDVIPLKAEHLDGGISVFGAAVAHDEPPRRRRRLRKSPPGRR